VRVQRNLEGQRAGRKGPKKEKPTLEGNSGGPHYIRATRLGSAKHNGGEKSKKSRIQRNSTNRAEGLKEGRACVWLKKSKK